MAGKRFLRILLCLTLAVLLLSGDLLADDIRILGDWSYMSSLIETEYRDGSPSEKTETERYKQNYRLDVSKELFPNLTLDAGAQMEDSRQLNEINNDESDSRNTSILPYVEAELRTSLYSLSAGYRERYERKRGTDIDTERNYVDSYNLRGEWRPVDLPRFDLSYQYTERHDKPFEQRNETSVLQFNSRYDYENYEFQYGYFRNEDNIFNVTKDKTGAITNTHNGRVRYSNNYLDGRVTLNAGLRGEYVEQSFVGSSTRDFPVDPTGNSFYVVNAELDPNDIISDPYPALDSNQLDLSGGDILNIGIDFGEAVEVDLLQITLDESPVTNSNISDLGNWALYVSHDRVSWSPRGISSVEYLTDENLLEIRLSQNVEHDYILLVYDPPVNPNQGQTVSITSLRALISRFLTDSSQLETHAINAQMGVGWLVTDKTRVLYDLAIQERKSSLFDDQRVRMNNGLTVLHRINETFSTTGRVSTSETWEQGRHTVSNYNYSAKLNARYLETLNQALIYSGGLNQEEEGDSKTNALLLHTNAELYRGWDVSFDQGYSWQSPAIGTDSSSFFVRIENRLVPHRRFNLTADYSITWEKETGSDFVKSDSGRLRVSWIPSDALSLQGEARLRVNEEGTDVFWEYGASWLPFRDGTLQCTLNYAEDEDADGNRTRSFSPNISWDMTEYANLGVRYSLGTEETNSEIDDFQSLLVNLKIYYD